MTRHIERLELMKREMTFDHWLPQLKPKDKDSIPYTWKDFDVEGAAKRYNTTESKVREAMKQIGRAYPKRKG